MNSEMEQMIKFRSIIVVVMWDISAMKFVTIPNVGS